MQDDTATVPATPTAAAVLELRHIAKTFAGVVALRDASFALREGMMHALVGENGAGKSTLIKVLASVHSPDDGVILHWGRPVRFQRGCGLHRPSP